MGSSIRALSSDGGTSAALEDALEDESDMDDPAMTSNVAGKQPQSRKPKLKTMLTRRWTHNEQLLVRPCGVIVLRCTFYQAESLPNERVCAFPSLDKYLQLIFS